MIKQKLVGMEIQFQDSGPGSWRANALLLPACEGDNLPDMAQGCAWLAKHPGLSDFKGKKGDFSVFHGPEDSRLSRVLAWGLGSACEVSLLDIREALASLARHCRSLGLGSALLPVKRLDSWPGGRDRLLQECAFAFGAGLYQFTKLKTKAEVSHPVTLALGMDAPDESAKAAASKGVADARALSLARDLDNMPGNLLYPETLALKAVELAQEHGFRCEVLAEDRLAEMGAGCLLGVGGGSTRKPRLIIVEHAPKGHEQDKPLIFIGKGITFDSGGLCIKPASGMEQMKCDMSGAAACLAAVVTAAATSVERRLVGVLACAENMPDGGAYRPGDILTALNGETVEIINTDAEGRLVLADALAYAQKMWTPAAMVDVATLTGACAVALGKGMAGLFCDDDSLAQKIAAYGAAAGENYWRLPLWRPYEAALKSEVADIRHTGAREGGAITAALFLKNFVAKGQLWAHLDIAGVDYNEKGSPLCPEGATGFGVRTLLALARGGIL